MSVAANDNLTSAADAPLEPLRLQPIKALRALSRLLKNKEDTEQVFIIMRALSGRSAAKGYSKLLKTAKGGRIAFRHEEIAKTLSDTEFLKGLPAGSVGAAYLHFTTSENISAQGLIDESRKVESDRDIDREHPIAWYGRRLRDIHDLWHVLTGYGRDGMGEACLVAFSYAQTRSPGFGLMGLAAAFKLKREVPNQPMLKAVWQAYQNGRKAAWLPGEDYIALLSEPLDAARARLNIPQPTLYQNMPDEIRANGMTPAMAA